MIFHEIQNQIIRRMQKMPQQNKENNTLGLHNINNYATYINNL